MRIRIVVADEAEARFYEVTAHGARPALVGQLADPSARLHDRDLKSDRPGRVFASAISGSARRGATSHHGTGGENTPRRHEAEAFAARIADELETALRKELYDRLIVMAGPPFLGTLRKALPKSVQSAIHAEVGKDLIHQPESAIGEHVPDDAFARAR